MKLNEKIKILRKKKNISQQELAKLIGVHLTHISRLEHGYFQPSLGVLKRLVEIFDVNANYFIDDNADEYEVKIKDKNLEEKIRIIDSLEEEDRRAIIQVIESMVKKKRMLDLVTKKQVTSSVH